MGVELGKVLAKNIFLQLDRPKDVKGHDSSVSDLRCSQGHDDTLHWI
jgi:glucose-6-phosphate isomerase